MVGRSIHTVPSGDPGAAAVRLPLRHVLSHTVALGLAIVATFSSAGTASPSLQLVGWTASLAGPSQAAAQTILEPAAPDVVASGSNVTVSWTPTTLSGGTPAQSYTVRRYTSGGTLQAIGAACSGASRRHHLHRGIRAGRDVAVLGAGSSGLMDGTRGHAQRSPYRSARPPSRCPVPPSRCSPPRWPDRSPASPPGRRSPSGSTARSDRCSADPRRPCPAAGAGPISVTDPDGYDRRPPLRVRRRLGRPHGRCLDRHRRPPDPRVAQRSRHRRQRQGRPRAGDVRRAPAPYTAGVDPWTLTNVPSGGSLSAVSVSGATATLTLSEGPSAASTAMGSFKVALARARAGSVMCRATPRRSRRRLWSTRPHPLRSQR